MRMSAVHLCKRRAICSCCVHPLKLYGRCGRMSSAHSRPLHWRRIVTYTAGAAVVSNVPLIDNCVAMDDRLVYVCVPDDGSIDAHDRSVVGEITSAPFTTHKSDSHVAESVVDSAVISNSIAPVAVVESISATFPSPPGRSPQCSCVGRGHPLAGNPVVTVVVGPISRHPHPPFLRT